MNEITMLSNDEKWADLHLIRVLTPLRVLLPQDDPGEVMAQCAQIERERKEPAP
jgi:hypothetical protein